MSHLTLMRKEVAFFLVVDDDDDDAVLDLVPVVDDDLVPFDLVEVDDDLVVVAFISAWLLGSRISMSRSRRASISSSSVESF